jgi:hypothetical protein
VISDADHPSNTGVCVRCREPRRWPEDFYDDRKVCKPCCRDQAAARRAQDPERERRQAKGRRDRAKARRALRDEIAVKLARAHPKSFHAFLWAALPDMTERQLSDFAAKIMPPDPEGPSLREQIESYYRGFG